MTRLTQEDICHIPSRLEAYNQSLLAGTGRSLLGIACHACDVQPQSMEQRLAAASMVVVPVTAGLGIITDFSQTVAAILNFVGVAARVSDKPDAAGLAQAYETGADAIMMADDHTFAGINLNTRVVVDNAAATGRAYAAALDLMAGGISGKDILVMGCGPVGDNAAQRLLFMGGRITLFDCRIPAAQALKERLAPGLDDSRVRLATDLDTALSRHLLVLEATPSGNSIPDNRISGRMKVAAPGVPLGLSDTGCQTLKHGLVHDKLELGVAVMAVSLCL